MTAATITNAQSVVVVRFNQTAETVMVNVEEAKQTALAAGRVAAQQSKQQAGQLVLSLTALLPLLLISGLVLAFSHANMMVIARMLPVCALAVLAFTALNLFNPGHSR
jgi:hypothetical protein